jgi:homocysteine S-methyltransferase
VFLMDLLDELNSRTVLGDGALGTLLLERGVPLEQCFEELCVSNPEWISAIHAQYIAAGARVIQTNSFGANAVRLAWHGLENRVGEINWSAAQLAKDAAKGKGVHIAGSIGPLGITADEARERGIDRKEVFMEQMGALLDGGARVILLETFQDLEELLIALEVKHSLHHCPVICSMVCNSEGRLPDGTLLTDAWEQLRAADADIVGVNCGGSPEAMLQLFRTLVLEGPVSAYPNAGSPEKHEGQLRYPATPEDFARAAVELAALGVRLIGGCCGTGPQHISTAADALKSAESRAPE